MAYLSGDLAAPLPGGPRLHAPQVRGAADGSLHLVWGSDSPPGFEDFFSTVLWYSSFRNGRWTEPEQIAQARRLFWNHTGQMAVDAIGRLHLALEARDSAFSGIIHIVRTESSVSQHRVSSSGAAEVALAVSGTDTIVTAYLGSAQRSDGNSVFFVRSLDGGRTWSRSSSVQLSGLLAANHLQVHVTGSNVHLLWRQSTSPDHEVLRYVRSSDLGDTWLPPSDFDFIDPVSDYRSIVDARGVVHVVYNVMSAEAPFGFRYVVWSDGWQAGPEPLPSSDAVSSFDAHRNSVGLPEIAAIALRRGGGVFADPRLVFLATTCQMP